MNNDRLGHILLKKGLIDSQQLDFCLSVQKNNGKQRLGHLLCHYDFVDEFYVAQALAAQINWPVFDSEYIADEKMLELFGLDFFIKSIVYPLRGRDHAIFVLARTDDTSTTDFINKKLDGKASFSVGVESRLRHSIKELSEQHQSLNFLKQKVIAEDSLTKWLTDCLDQAVLLSASDIHIESSQKVVEVRFRIDGILCFIDTLPLKCLPRLINILFHMAEVTISDFNHFHDARFLHAYSNREIDVRVSHIPSVNGSAVVLRLLDKSKSVMDLSELGYSPRSAQLIQDSLTKPNGICLIVGPTGCGKTTTLYAILNYLKSIDQKIVTIEDPVEIQLPLMTQVQINEKRGISFHQSIRAFLRHDPDIILVGEIRDELTAQEALRAVMTGHQVFSTLHANRAIDAIVRLHDLGLPYSYMADHLSLIVSQRLVRKLCSFCKTPPTGCSQCRGGYCGQTVVAEVLVIDEKVSELIFSGDLVGLKRLLKDNNHLTMADDARDLIERGITTREEIRRILG